uniref:Uncharacterized protein n=1 Tax=Acrobeloides nanus TaxID=290746 RepID=A0A914CAL7_9BILA
MTATLMLFKNYMDPSQLIKTIVVGGNSSEYFLCKEIENSKKIFSELVLNKKEVDVIYRDYPKYDSYEITRNDGWTFKCDLKKENRTVVYNIIIMIFKKSRS